jgi:hypothetical protein
VTTPRRHELASGGKVAETDAPCPARASVVCWGVATGGLAGRAPAGVEGGCVRGVIGSSQGRRLALAALATLAAAAAFGAVPGRAGLKQALRTELERGVSKRVLSAGGPI